ncbi:hypothetical protein XH88_27165 [Bradyrhizobium sp. CCBAU 51627]|nr:hypothetical protein [Bradyrhizobium sp. CCBAU 51627]
MPAAIAALITAFFYPAVGTVLGWLQRDRAAVTVHVFNRDIVNVGLDDQAASNRVDRVANYESLLRGQLVNSGFSVASILSNFACAGETRSNEREIYTFNFHDVQRGTKAFPEVPTRSTVSFFGRLTHAQTYPVNGMFSSVQPKHCQFTYYDKYGLVQPPLSLSLTDSQVALLKTMVPRDEPGEWRGKYCEGKIPDMAVSDRSKADCVGGNHVIAIEASYRWPVAVSRSLADAKSFSDVSGSRKLPGAILVCDDDCASASAEASVALTDLGVPLTTWWCKQDSRALKDCERKDFPKPKAG